MRLRANRIIENALVGPDGTWAWWKLPGLGWDFRPILNREAQILSWARVLSGLVGRQIHVRVTHRPWSAERWRIEHIRDATNPLPGWENHINATVASAGHLGTHDKVTVVGVRFGRTSLSTFANWPGIAGDASSRRNVLRQSADIARVDNLMRAVGGRPLSATDLEWLTFRSVALGLPDDFERIGPRRDTRSGDEIQSSVARVVHDPVPFSRSLRIMSEDRAGNDIERYVVVGALGAMADMEIPQRHEPWLRLLDQAPFPVELSQRSIVMSQTSSRSEMRHAIRKVAAQVSHYTTHGEPPPPSLARQQARALAITDELETSSPDAVSARARVWTRFAVSGATEAEALGRFRDVQEICGQLIATSRIIDQFAGVRGFIPGERPDSQAHVRRMPVASLAAAVPHAMSVWGDRHGIYLGRTTSAASTPAFLQPWDAPANAETGLMCVAGGLGAGKSMLGGWLVYASAMTGVRWNVFDPSGKLQALATIPELSGRVRVVDVLEGAPGSLSPFGVIADPSREHFDETDYRARVEASRRDRRELAQAIIERLLPPAMGSHPLTAVAIAQAMNQVEPTPSASLLDVVQAMRMLDNHADEDLAVHARRCALLLDGFSGTSVGRLLFPPLPAVGESHIPAITVYSLRGLSLSDDDVQNEETKEREAACVLSSAAWLVTRDMYLSSPSERKGVLLDEARVLRRVAQGRTLIESISADSRKHNTVVAVLDQQASALSALGLPNLSSMAFIGRLNSEPEQRAALEFLKVEADQGYEQVVGGLSHASALTTDAAREFLARDWKGRVERIVFSPRNSHPHVFQALQTSPQALRTNESRRVLSVQDGVKEVTT